MRNELYPTQSEYCIRFTGKMYDYVNRLYEKKLRNSAVSPREQARISIEEQELRRVIRRAFPEFHEFMKQMKLNKWLIDKRGGSLLLIAYYEETEEKES